MSDRPKSRLAWTIAAAAVGLVAVAAAVFLVMRPDDEVAPRPDDDQPALQTDPETYREMVSAFFAGVAALDAEANDRAKAELTRATQLVPEEPAGWLNLGLTGIRLGEEEAAVQALEHARTLSPESGAAARLLGLLESRRGRPTEAIEHFRRAVEKNPGDVRSMYALAEEIERQGADGAIAEAGRLIAEILEQRPENLAVLLERARLAVKAEDLETLRDIVSKLRPLSAGWSEQAREQFRRVEEAVEAGDVRQLVPQIARLRNVLIAEPAFRASLAEVQSPVGVVGVPVQEFMKLPAPPPTPSPPDMELSFAVEPLTGSEGQASTLVAVPAIEEGQDELFVANGREIRLVGDERPPLPFPGGPESTPPGPDGLLAVDWNSDYAIDLVAAGAGGLRLFRREEDGSFADATKVTRLEAEVVNAAAVGVWAADIELDGDLDLVVGRREGETAVLQNRGDGTFGALQPFEGVAAPQDFVWSDLNRDGVPDASFLDGQGTLHVFLNERSGRYGRKAVPDDLSTLRAVTTGDANADGVIDLVLLKSDGAVARLTLGADDSEWQSAEIAEWDDLPEGEPRLFLADLDNNGGLDLVGTGEAGTRFWLADGTGRLQPLAAQVDARVFAILDLNADGRLDLAGIAEGGEPVHVLNRGTKSYHWQALRPRAAKVVGDGRINSFGLGGEMELRSGLLVQKQVVSGPTVHFGLGENPQADVVQIVWPNGTVQAEFDLEADQVVKAEQRLKGSCPFVFAHDGTAMRFVTDFLWRSPLGLRINAQDTAGSAQTEDWIKIAGDQLAPRDGHYDIRITAELWETHYFDHVSLIVVDHPEGTEVFVDERFARTPPALTLHPTGPLYPVMARDDHGDDVTEVVRSADGHYLDTFGRGQYQGVTRDHWVEVEIGDEVPRDESLRLIARGWVHPTDSSINVALSQGRHEPPRGLSLEVPAEDGGWTVAHADLGFPAGKDKTIIVDLDGLFPPEGPRRFRLRTNLEVFWDRLAVATAGDAESLRTQRLAPTTADLRHRGYSLMTQADASSPELPHYDVLTGTAQRWRDLIGYYTRYGDVRELLAEVDDRYIIANAGDEVVLRFPAPPAPPAGWVRDFVLVGDGWNKDGDFNTAFSETVLPLPSHDRPAYDVPPGDLEDDPVYRKNKRDWEVYHTRYVVPDVFRNGLRPLRASRRQGD